MRKMVICGILMLLIVSIAANGFAASLKFPDLASANKLQDDFGGGEKNSNKETENKTVITVADKSEYKIVSDVANIKHEGKVYATATADEIYTFQAGINYEVKTKAGIESEKWEMENLWLQAKVNKAMIIRGGKQTYHVAKGLFIDQDGVFGVRFIYNPDKNNAAEVFNGRDSQDVDVTTSGIMRSLQVVNVSHKFSKQLHLGTYFAHQQTTDGKSINRFRGGYGKIEVAPKTNVNFEYVHNTTLNKTAYIAELQQGNSKVVGGWSYGLDYMKVDAKTFETNDYTDFDTQYTPKNGFKGPGVIIGNRITKHSTIQAQRWWGRNLASTGAMPISKLLLVVNF
ncbi:MAG: hypothetical protein H6Q67_1289 [Firmicutes bacterium]|nr:hypothetical protein [Bacillota bacterium]